MATLLGAACCVRLAIVLRHVVTCWGLQIVGSNLAIFKLEPTTTNMSQHIALTVAKRTQHVAPNVALTYSIVWPEFYYYILSFGRSFITQTNSDI